MYQWCSKNTIPSKHWYIQPFPVKLHKMLLSILIKPRSHILPWLILSHWGSEIWKHQIQFTERSLATCNRYCHHQNYLQSNSKNVRRTSGRNKSQVARLESSILQSRIFSYKLPNIDFSFSQSGPYKGLGHRKESQICTEKLALNTSNKSLL